MTMTPKKNLFVAKYLGEAKLNATQAALLAGYSERTAKSQGSRLLTDVDVQAAIQAAQERAIVASGMTRERWLQELERLALSDVRRLFTVAGSMLNPADMDDDVGPAVSAVEVVERPVRGSDGEVEVEHVRKVKLHDKLRALELYGKAAGWVSGNGINVNVQVAQFVDRPPEETREEWLARKERERQERLAGPAVERPR